MAQYSAERDAGPVLAVPAVANPAPLGLSAFALTTFVLSSSNAGFLFSKSSIAGAIVIGLALFYGGLVQIIAGVQEFRQGNTFGATAFCSYGGFWMAFGFTLLPIFAGKDIVGLVAATPGASAADATAAVGVFLLGWTIFTGLMFIGTLRISGALIAVFGLLFLTFLFLTIGFLGGGSTLTTWVPIGGWLGIVTAIVAWYAALAGVLASVKLANLPTLPMG
jgi:succinate-acetate transporter protein